MEGGVVSLSSSVLLTIIDGNSSKNYGLRVCITILSFSFLRFCLKTTTAPKTVLVFEWLKIQQTNKHFNLLKHATK